MGHWVELARASTPEGDELILRQRGEEFEIRFNGWEVMSNGSPLSESALARLALAELRGKPSEVLVGGLGMGFTLRATLDAVSADARVTVSELVPAVVDWLRGPLASLACRPLDDPRVELRIGSVIDVLATSRQCFDAILLDTDNGPQSVLHEPNRFLYAREGLALAKRAVRPEGIVGFWSADRSAAFEDDLDAAGLRWRRVAVDARGGGRGPEHSIYLARPTPLPGR
jgi:spermidine synthase